MTLTMKLTDPDAPFFFAAGERVAWRQPDGSAHREFRGPVVAGEVTFEVPGAYARPIIGSSGSWT